ncbi:eppin [Cricetulus griseus]|uniref:Eppin n=1 Tax=Cricetulus griseus TaxID=10029 RepID=A0A9J7H0U8_CRIGR|nr:eppin [Cricetulus griseus]XP_035313091.1 eppin [Cricetulus griseus]
MRLSGFVSLLLLFGLLANVQGFSLTDFLFSRRCPRFREHCEHKERDLCTRDKDCQKKEKCCVFNCGKKCLNPQQDICSLPKDSGYCMAYFPRWWYNKENSTCELFIYGGCQGNNNNFQTQAICQNTCKKKNLTELELIRNGWGRGGIVKMGSRPFDLNREHAGKTTRILLLLRALCIHWILQNGFW